MIPIKNKKLAHNKGEKLIVSDNLISMFIKHVYDTPDEIALITSETNYSYLKLYQEVLIWKNQIKSLSITSPILLCIHRSPRMLAILLALQWLEISYIPIELKTPSQRIKDILKDSKAQALLHDTAWQEEFMSLSCKIFYLPDLIKTAQTNIATIPETPPPISNTTAYIIYTSGSTGIPKGVSISQKSLSNFLASMSTYFLKSNQEMLLATTTISFDISYLELYLPIWTGKTIFLASQSEHKDPEKIQNILNKYPITLCQGTTSFWNMLLFSGWQGKKDLHVLCGGEPLTSSVVNKLIPKIKELWNMYGPTEATIWCSLKKITSPEKITIGKPIHNMQMLILNSTKNVVPYNTKGELYIGGIGLADGYINHQRLTEKKFITYRRGLLSYRLYHSGDIASMNDNSEIILHGRVDNQIKLHGYRIELEDIESHIQANLWVKECVVGVFQEQLVAYVCIVPGGKYNEAELVKQLKQELPEFMIPKRFVYLDKLPLNNSGKLDRKALYLPNNEIHHTEKNTTPLQEKLIQIWHEILNINNVSIHDNFFELGGHSLLAVRIAAKIQKELKKMVKAHDIYRAPTIQELAELVKSAPNITHAKKTNFKEKSSRWLQLTDFQFVIWLCKLFEPEVPKLNITERLRINSHLDINALNLALAKVLLNHDIFSYTINNFFPLQKKGNTFPIQWIQEDIQNKNTEETENYLLNSIKKLSLKKHWQKNSPLIVAKLFYLTENRTEMQMAISHLIADQQSIDILFQHLSLAYLYYTKNTATNIQIENKPFAYFVQEQNSIIRSSLYTDEKFWLDYLADTDLLHFPNKYILTQKENENTGYSNFFPLSENTISKWRSLCINNSITLNELLSAAIGIVITKLLKNIIDLPQNIFINTVRSSREDPCYDEAIGCFLKSQPIKLALHENDDLLNSAKAAQKASIETANHQQAPSLLKISAIGKVAKNNNIFTNFMISLFANIYNKFVSKSNSIQTPIIEACKRLACSDRNRGFVININIWNNFLTTSSNHEINLFGNKCQAIPITQKDIQHVNRMIDICLLRDNASNQPFLAISANLIPELRLNIGNSLLEVLNQ